MKFRFRLFGNRYSVFVTRNYCGAQAENLGPLPGESWVRGRDLRDGRLWKLPLVLWDVLAYEFGFGRWALVGK